MSYFSTIVYRYMDHGTDFDSALKSCDSTLPSILVAHQPASAKEALATDYRVDLVLSGNKDHISWLK